LQSASPTPFLTLGTRGSPLALIQAEEVRRRLAATHGVTEAEIAIKTISTAGDRSQPSNRPLSEIGGKGLFSKEIEARLLDGTIDIAVHSAKDMATRLPDRLVMPYFLPREDVRDAFISLSAASLDELPRGARFGTSSIRRRAQLLRVRPDLQMREFRGNVGTRLKKLADGQADATLLAAAGLIRSHESARITAFLDPDRFPPAPAQGAIGLEMRAEDERAHALTLPLNDPATAAAIIGERAFLSVIDGSCQTPIAALSKYRSTELTIFGQILSPDGQDVFESVISGGMADSHEIGLELGHKLIGLAGHDFIARLRSGQ